MMNFPQILDFLDRPPGAVVSVQVKIIFFLKSEMSAYETKYACFFFKYVINNQKEAYFVL